MMFMDQLAVAGEVGEKIFIAEAEHERPAGNRHEQRTFELPRAIWTVMFTSYALFFGALIIATGSTLDSAFMIVVSIGYTIMYFGTAAILVRTAKRHAAPSHEPRTAGALALDTITGPMGYGAVAAQVLTVPAMFALFGISIAIICSIVLV